MIAEKHNTTPSCVERIIPHAIELAWNRDNLDMMNRYFGYAIDIEKDKPTNFEFITKVSDKLIRDKLA